MSKPRLLILSFSPIASDARVLKQVKAFAPDYELTTCGYGPTPPGVARHVQIPDDIAHNVLHDRLIRWKWYRRQYWSLWSVKWVKEHLTGTWDVVLANDVEAVPLALSLKPVKGVHADLHEYSPLLHEDWQGWTERITPYVDWVCREYVTKASSWTTVGNGLAREYEKNFGFRPELVINAAPYVDATPTPVGDPIRLVHSGAAMSDRRLDTLIEAAAGTTTNVTLDLYLTPNQPAYLEQLKAQAAQTGGRVTVHDPVPYAALAETLRQHDVGISMNAPTSFNNIWSLPNKVFDYVQARLGLIVGPSPETAQYVTDYGLGMVTDGFTVPEVTAALDAMTAADVTRWKAGSHAAAHELSAEPQIAIWKKAVDTLAGI